MLAESTPLLTAIFCGVPIAPGPPHKDTARTPGEP